MLDIFRLLLLFESKKKNIILTAMADMLGSRKVRPHGRDNSERTWKILSMSNSKVVESLNMIISLRQPYILIPQKSPYSLPQFLTVWWAMWFVTSLIL